MSALAGLYASHPFWIWGALAAAILAAEVLTGTGWLLWAAASAAATAAVVAGLDVPFAAALLVFAALTMASTLLARRYLPRDAVHTDGDINDNVARLTGRRGAAVGPFSGRSGRVFVDGKEWAAELEDDGALEAGAAVQVVSVDGARLTVRRA